MKKIFLISITSCLVLAISASGQQTPAGLELSGFTLEEKSASLAGTLNSYRVAVIQLAKQRGQSAEEAGVFMGRFFAPAWPEKLTPAEFVANMNHGWGKYDIKTKVFELTPESVTARRTRPYEAEAFEERYDWAGGNLEEFEQFQEAMVREIAKHVGLIYREERKDSVIIFTVETQR